MGGYSFVKGATRRRDQQRTILKFLPKQKNRPCDSGLPHEIDTLLSLDSDMIVKVVDVYEGPDYFVMAMERFGDGLDLFEYISSVDHLTEEQSRLVMRQVVQAVVYLAENNIVHGDIKDENVIIDTETFAIKLIDFGSCRTFTPGQLFETFVGTRHIACPEVAANQAYDPIRQELWSLGVLLFILLTGDYPFETPVRLCTAPFGSVGRPTDLCAAGGHCSRGHQARRYRPAGQHITALLAPRSWPA